MLFSTASKNTSLQPGDFIVVGTSINGKFSPIPVKGKVIRIWVDNSSARTQIDLSYGELGNAKVYMHDEYKTWMRVSNFN